MIRPSATCGTISISNESVISESAVLVIVIVKGLPLTGAPAEISLTDIVILPDCPDSRVSERVSTLIVNQSLTCELSMLATNVSVEVPKFVIKTVRFESLNGDAMIRSSLESTNTSCRSAICKSIVNCVDDHPPSNVIVKVALLG